MKPRPLKNAILACLAAASILTFTSCDTVDERDDNDDDDHAHRRGATTTTTTEEITVTRPAAQTVETQTIQY